MALLDESCIICYEDTYDKIEFKCLHKICIKCYQDLINKFDKLNCPMCRTLIEDNTVKEHSIEIIHFNYESQSSIDSCTIIKVLLTALIIILIVKYLI
jgi:hypothetical protein